MNVAFIQHAENDIHGHERSEDQDRLIRQRGLKSLRRSLESGVNALWKAKVFLGLLDGVDGLAERCALLQVEGKRDHRKLPLVVDGDRRELRRILGEGAERNLRPVG